jgi:hypothetical protein
VSRVYLYGLLGAAPSCEAGVGVCAERLRVVPLGALVALVGDVAEAPAPTAMMLRAQDGVLRRLAGVVDAVLPVRFGTLMADDAALADALAPRGPQLARALALVSGCEQMTLRVWAEVTAAPAPAPEEGSGEWAHRVPELEPARRRLGDLVREERTRRHDRPPLLATVQHLIRRGAAGRYLEEIDAARDGLKPWRVSVTGPWLAYAFAEEAA